MLYTSDGSFYTQGSGVYWDYGEILTAYHVIDEHPMPRTSDGLNLSIKDMDSKLDATTLTSTQEVRPVKIGDSDEVKVGDKVILVTSSDGKGNTVTYGKVLELNAANLGKIFIWAGVDGGASGGACFNMQGELIGIVSNGSETDDGNLVIPINDIRQALSQKLYK